MSIPNNTTAATCTDGSTDDVHAATGHLAAPPVGNGPNDHGPFLSGPSDMAVDQAPVAVGACLLGRFRVERLLGEGRSGSVYLAQDADIGCPVALKIMPMAEGASDFPLGLVREMRVAMALRGSGAAIRARELLRAWSGDGSALAVLTMEYAPEGSFREWLRARRAAREDRLATGIGIFRSICRNVGEAHRAGVLHLDLKPSNVLLIDGEGKLADFGCMRSGIGPGGGAPQRETAAPRWGTPEYMAPEGFDADGTPEPERAADIYSLGIMLYEIASTECLPPFVGSLEHVRSGHLAGVVPPLPADVSWLERVVERCLARNPGDRYKTAEELLADLDWAWDESGARASDRIDDETEDRCEDLWEDVEAALSQGDLEAAGRAAMEILDICPDHRDARLLAASVERRRDVAGELFSFITENLEHGDLAQLTDLALRAEEEFPEHPRAAAVRHHLSIRARAFGEQMAAAGAALAAGNLDLALCAARAASQTNRGCAATSGFVDILTGKVELRERMREQIDVALAAGNGEQALALARRLDSELEVTDTWELPEAETE